MGTHAGWYVTFFVRKNGTSPVAYFIEILAI